MKAFKIAGPALALTLIFAISASASNDIFSVKTALTTTAARKSYGISVVSGEVLEFSVSDLEMRLGLPSDSLGGITVTSLPKPEHGELLVDGADVSAFEFIDRSEVDKLCFVPGEEVSVASMTFIPGIKGVGTSELFINILSEPNNPPEIQPGFYDTVLNSAVFGYITAYDLDGDDIEIRAVKPPNKGIVRFDGLSFRYIPYKNASGKDSFSIRAVDAVNNFSDEASISINIEKPKNGFYYTDMSNNPAAYAAVKLREKSVMSGRQIGGKFFFLPDETVTRGEFLVMLLSAGGLERSIKPTVNTGLSNDASIPVWLKPYVKKAVDEGIWLLDQPFIHDQPLTRAEAVVLVDRFSKIDGAEDFKLQLSDVGSIPQWTLRSYQNLASRKMLELYDNMAYPSDELTNGFAAILIWQLWKFCN